MHNNIVFWYEYGSNSFAGVEKLYLFYSVTKIVHMKTTHKTCVFVCESKMLTIWMENPERKREERERERDIKCVIICMWICVLFDASCPIRCYNWYNKHDTHLKHLKTNTLTKLDLRYFVILDGEHMSLIAVEVLLFFVCLSSVVNYRKKKFITIFIAN